MDKPSLKSSSKNISLIILITVIIGITLWYLLAPKPALEVGEEIPLNISKYASLLKNIEKITKLLEVDLFNSSPFKKLKSFITLPLELGRVGKDNPFEAPPAPEELLLIPRE